MRGGHGLYESPISQEIGFVTLDPIFQEMGFETRVPHLPNGQHLQISHFPLHQHLPLNYGFHSGRQPDLFLVTTIVAR